MKALDIMAKLAKAIIPCRHKWVFLEHINAFTPGYSADNNIPTRFKKVLQCEKCGDIKSVSV